MNFNKKDIDPQEQESINKLIQKYMQGLDITYNIEQTRRLIYAGKPSACYEATAYHKGKKEYEQHHCYSRRSDGTIIYEEGNEVKGVGDGIFAYLGMNNQVRKYFETKTRNAAKEFLDREYSW